MNRFVLIACSLIAPGWFCFGQTDSPAAAALPSPRPALKSPAEPKQDAPAKAAPAGAGLSAGQISLEGNPARIAAAGRQELEAMLRPAEPASGTDFERKTAAAFKPKIIRAGRAQIYSSVATAIARKNPLCLLDPTFLSISFH